MDGRSRNSRRKATSSVVAEGPTVPSRKLRFDLGGSREEASLLATRRSRLGRSRPSPRSGVLATHSRPTWRGIMQECRFEPQESDDIWTHSETNRPLAPVFEIRLEV